MEPVRPPVRIAMVGAGMIGRRHLDQITPANNATLAAVVDPSPDTATLAAHLGAPWFTNLETCLAEIRPEAAIIATPNAMHVPHGLACVAAGVPALVEKPVADTLQGAETLVAAAAAANVTLLTGHHRRHNPIVQAAKAAIDQGLLGRLVAVHANCWFHKPANYFTPAWRREPGAGPVLLNMVHDIDMLRLFCGEVASVQAIESAAIRGHAVEDTAAVLLRFHGGALGTITVSDTISAPWSWEMTSGENPIYTHTDQSAFLLGGTHGSLSVPGLELWRHANEPDWWTELRSTRLKAPMADPLALQVQNLCAVVRGTAAPVVTAREGAATLRTIDAIKRAAESRTTVTLGPV